MRPTVLFSGFGLALAALGGTGIVQAAPDRTGRTGQSQRVGQVPLSAYAHVSPDLSPAPSFAQDNELIQEFCVSCHSDRKRRGNLSLEAFDVARAVDQAETAEKIIRKLRAGMMPPPGEDAPEEAALQGLASTLEATLDAAASAAPNPGSRTFQRLNQAEYAASIRDLLQLEIDPSAYLPEDTKSANFDNIADVQLLSATLMKSYLTAASEIARLAVGDPEATPSEATYSVSRLASQRVWVEGAPFGTRGGLSVIHNFPADGQYAFRVRLQPSPTGQLFGRTARDEQLEISIDGERVALIKVDRWMSQADPTGMEISTDSVHLRAGPHRLSAAFLPRMEGPVSDIVGPVGHSLADTQIGLSYGVKTLPHLRDLVVGGPSRVTGVSDTPSRREIFRCRPTSPREAEPCARRILGRLGTRAYRRSLTEHDMDVLMDFYAQGTAEGGFELGVRTGLQAMLASPWFVFRLEETGTAVDGNGVYRISDTALASRLSFFLWGAPPDGELLALARDGRLSEPDVLEAQVERMLAAPAAAALGGRFAAQWLRLSDIEKVHPDALSYPDFDLQLSGMMRKETRLFFNYLVSDDRSALELLSADYTFVNERLAAHYGIAGVAGPEFRKVSYPDTRRRGLLGHGSVLTLTSHANRTSPVLRGKWVMEVLLGTPPPPPPPDVPDLDATEPVEDGRRLTVREQMELHRSKPMCNSCHTFMDPIGLALDNFDVVGKWRVRENGNPVDASGVLYDGTPLNGPEDLRRALLSRPEPFLRNFAENLMVYAIGRRIEFFDMPSIREITRSAAVQDYRLTAFIMGVVRTPAFQMKRVGALADEQGGK